MEDWEEKRRIISVRLNQEVRLNVFSFYRNDLIYRSRLEGFQVSGSHKHGKSSMCLGKKKRKKITAAINRKRIKVGREWGSSGVPNSFARSYELALLGEHWIRSQNRNSTERHASRHFRLRMSKKLNSFFFFYGTWESQNLENYWDLHFLDRKQNLYRNRLEVLSIQFWIESISSLHLIGKNLNRGILLQLLPSFLLPQESWRYTGEMKSCFKLSIAK